MTDTAAPTPRLRDIPAALGLLSRLPIPIDPARATARGAQAVWAYPVAGLVLGGLAAAVTQSALWLGIPAMLAAALALISLVILTGAMHEDGLADTADGLWGGWDAPRRLEIMKDSRIGVYGVMALVGSFALRWHALGLLIVAGATWPAMLLTASLSRAAMLPVMTRLPHARATGLSRSVGSPDNIPTLIGLAIALAATLILWPAAALPLLVVGTLVTFAVIAIARAKIGGQTGDILGATQNLTETALLITLTTLVT
ncbi:adenosylcobinamide-GDP ribazoletransferase [Thalassorhabdomicrobium marinisediminis]|uniref:Adenosylcobinamide-GDP ribazoletransferase n=1 Tax=Thalassorhabdomicrobium marinisediminis TaxID=2170577 RepID=A0A2T7FXS4_9RHOB|nr:adenosylcobinamide-GDP ribazoletransferase [Thalassorhabdomicrobium marinisediminis]PVA06973.1 adenosylcobinamide-GDP ribazoletransferase [Thalassorhabdomicrobium marinisediminis]